MKGVVFLGDRKLELREFPDPTPGPRDVILEIKASGMCGSDLHNYRAPANPGGVVTGGIKRAAGVIAGHEPCGVVAAVGTAVTDRDARIGQRVMDHHYDGCGNCKHCRAGWTRGNGGLRLRWARRPREIHEGAGVDAGAAAGLALLRHRGRHLLRHRHGLGRAATGPAAWRRNDRHLRPGPSGPVGDAAGR